MPPRTPAQEIDANETKITRLEAKLSTDNENEASNIEGQLAKCYAKRARLKRKAAVAGGASVGVDAPPERVADEHVAASAPAPSPPPEVPAWDSLPILPADLSVDRQRVAYELAAEEGCLLSKRRGEGGLFLLGLAEDRRAAGVLLHQFMNGSQAMQSGAAVLFGIFDRFTGGGMSRLAPHLNLPANPTDAAAVEILRRRPRRLAPEEAAQRLTRSQPYLIRQGR